ncbi:MAG: bifunctional DNA-formamidopyrimidine glycosylase/DNA-(apurinic or apyrimidinic site) lyase [Peptococcaceae bacterium]|nr:bifunctional DNA-formamidopyrimidine glycosylase/DNA-(apurinic or apyrimidinic site) lyase [Peptococcaceae bacterium]
MPELPEVETVCAGLRRHLLGRRITGVHIYNEAVIHTCPGGAAQFAARIRGKTICAITRRGKYILIALSEGWLVCHLRMTGKLLVRAGDAARGKHDHVVFELDDGRKLFYEDVRRFGGFAYHASDPLQMPPLADLGPEPLSADFSGEVLWRNARGRKRPVKAQLLDQHVVAGIGNIYADEILFRAGIRPRKGADRLTKAECARIAQATKVVLAEAIQAGGSTIRDYVDSDAQAGHFQLAHQVYGRAGAPCRVCGSILKSVQVAGRTSVYCPHCQKS